MTVPSNLGPTQMFFLKKNNNNKKNKKMIFFLQVQKFLWRISLAFLVIRELPFFWLLVTKMFILIFISKK